MIAAFSILIALPAYAEDVVLTHQIRVLDASGTPISGARAVTVELFENDATPNVLWSETFDATLEQGFASLQLGQNPANPLPGGIAAQARYAQVRIDNSTLGARQRLSGVPLAARSLTADSVEGDVTVSDLQLQTESAAPCAASTDYGKIRWNGGAFQGCRPGGWSNLLMADPGDMATTGMVDSPGLIAYFEGSCPNGWAEKATMRGRVVVATSSVGAVGETIGAALANGGTRTITEAPRHAHAVTSTTATSTSAGGHAHTVDPPNQRSGSQTANHTHAVDPPSTATSTTGNHGHGIATRQDDWNVSGGPSGGRPSWGTDNGPYAVRHNTDNAGNHAHSLNIGSFTSSGVSVNHQHDTNIPAFTSASAGSHNHALTVSGQSATAGGPTEVDVTMPYIHLIGCERE
ncbi:MAG: hypothetical protein ACJAZO_000818 [Myxococcota bacterium]|jgi:hypothetical protein